MTSLHTPELLIRADRAGVTSTLARGIAHDLRGPLQALTLLGDLHTDLVAGEDSSQMRATIGAAVEHLAGTISRFSLVFAPLETELSPLVVNEILTSVSELQRYQRTLPAPEVRVRVPEGVPAVRGIDTHLRHLLLSLIINAKQALVERSDAEIELAASVSGDAVELSVEDNGPGLTPEERSRAFDLFHTTRPGALGLGLPVARWLAERQRATVSLEQGSRGGVRAVVRLEVWKPVG